MFRNSRWIGCVCLGVALATSSAQAQIRRPSPQEIGQIIDATLAAALPLADRFSGGHLAEREIRFDYGRTMAAFGYADKADARASLGLTRAMIEGSRALLKDCDQQGMGKCPNLVQSAYAFVVPTSVADSEAVVWVYVSWATTLSGRTYLSGWGSEVFLRRSGSGPWTFVRTGRGEVT